MIHYNANYDVILRENTLADSRYSSLGLVGDRPFVPLVSLQNMISTPEGLLYNLGDKENTYIYTVGRSYSGFIDKLKRGTVWKGIGIAGCEKFLINRGIILDLDVDKIIMCVMIKQEALGKYVEFFSNSNSIRIHPIKFDPADLVLCLSHDFVTEANAVYKKVYRKLNKDYFIPHFYNKGIEVRHVKEIHNLAFRHIEFPVFETLENRKDFYRILPNFITGSPKLNLIWQPTEIEVLDTNGNVISSPYLETASTYNNTSPEKTERLKWGLQESSVEYSTTSE